ncbi:hypothetical protein BO71DRAFT_394000 [Aspergillus ellipticus CBS 707.79]|uniref:Aminoglycoside phosphotransferase domain-containing protein n=1 Tax=Aspergillus ellipticus CBS 707.79 TaxID=1448320 RepID=A0A319DQM6_9EURO|nr:hypothetical protein BO71DRAFT_394000 [Aspergillus ellipticus CBS 707.79]
MQIRKRKREDDVDLPFTPENLEEGYFYIHHDRQITEIPEAVDPHRLPDSEDLVRVLSKKEGSLVIVWDRIACVCKSGWAVPPVEEEAMKLVKQHTSVPVPNIIESSRVYRPMLDDRAIYMGYIPGVSLKERWPKLDSWAKHRVCRQLWHLIEKIQEIPRPDHMNDHFQGPADGSSPRHPLIEDLGSPSFPLMSDEDVRARIHERYLYFCGCKYESELPDMLPRAERSVFAHGDLSPRHIMVDDDNKITGILSWENAGWYPEYWEYINVMKWRPDNVDWSDWMDWMEFTASKKWDMTGIRAARTVLF